MNLPLLAIDCSFGGYSLALYLAPETPITREADEHPTTSIITSIDDLLGEAKLKPSDLASIACGIGPGLFSGIRASVATASGIAYVHKLPVSCVPTPLAVANESTNDADNVLIAQPAHRGYCYLAGYTRKEGWRQTLAPSLHDLAQLPVIDSTAQLYLHAKLESLHFLAHSGPTCSFTGTKLAPSVGKLALEDTGELVQTKKSLEVKPHYVREKVALTKQERLDGVRL